MRTAFQQTYGTHLTMRNVRRVWAAATRTPRASKRELAARLDLSYGAVTGALRFLRDAGYIDFPPGGCRAITVLVPLHTSGWRIVARGD